MFGSNIVQANFVQFNKDFVGLGGVDGREGLSKAHSSAYVTMPLHKLGSCAVTPAATM